MDPTTTAAPRAAALAATALIAALAAAGFAAAGDDERAFGAEDEKAIRAVLEAQDAAWNRGDIEGFMEGYDRSPDLVFTSGGKIRRGFDVTLERYKKTYANDDAMGKLSFSDLEITGVGPDAAVVLGRWKLTDTPKAGGGVFTLVMVRREAGWRIIHDHTSSDAE